jgi:Short C-terminal domain
VDQLAELKKLAEMQEQGLLTPEEFAAMKAKIIAL